MDRACGQFAVDADDAEAEKNPTQHPFLLPAQPTEIGEAMEDFRRFAGRKQWEKAFKHLEKVFAATSNGLVLTGNGIMLPSRLIAREALLELPPAGQDAYRLFFDAEAKKLLEQAQGPEELNKLTQIFSRFLVTSSGDAAADKLGDLHFEAGNFAQAANAWRAVLEERPDSRLSKARLRVKLAIALARQEHWSEFRAVLKIVEQQHAEEKMTLGGHKSLPSSISGPWPSGAKVLWPMPPLRHTAGLLPMYRCRPTPSLSGSSGFFHRRTRAGNNPPGLRIQQMWGNAMSSDMVPPVVFDQSRLYANFLGYDLGIDLESGKLLWRSGRFFDAPQKAQQGGAMAVEQFGLVAGVGRIWSVSSASNNPIRIRTR